MKIALMTWYTYKNYGTFLQLTALNEFLKENGHDADIIKYEPQRIGKSIPDYSLSFLFNKLIKKVEYIVSNAYGKNKSPLKYSDYVNFQRDKLFDDYLFRKVKFTDDIYSLTDLENLNDEYDAFICGSDQIWSPNNYNPHYFLDFVYDSDKIISYAPSIGLPSIEDSYVKSHITGLINRIKYLSIRESQGYELIKEITGRNAEVVLDPSFLLTKEQWMAFCNVKKTEDTHYLLIYMLGHNESHWNLINKIAEKKKLEIKIIPVFNEDLKRKGCIKEPIGPEEFVSLISNSEYICTDSFHGTVFSIIFHKPFSVFERFDKKDSINQNSRIFNVLNIFSLNDRIVRYNDKKIDFENHIDFTSIDPILDGWRAKSTNFLLNALNDIKEKDNRCNLQQHVLIKNSLCCGCGSCSSVCPKGSIQIKYDGKGFLKAFVDESTCVNCGKCLNVCPFASKLNSSFLTNAQMYSYKDNNLDVLKESSSGGFAYSFSSYLIDKGYAVAGCTFDVNKQIAKHILVNNKNDLHLLQSSKYMQSHFNDCIPLIQSYNGPVAIFGTPCQIAGVKKVLSNRNNIIYIDLICHGVPSYHLFNKYKSVLNKRNQFDTDNLKVIFRYKPMGWREKYICLENGKNKIVQSEKTNPYLRFFETTSCFSKACYDCRWRDNSAADIRIGDYWGPKFMDDSTGVNMILSVTSSGNTLINDFINNNYGKMIKQNIDDYYLYQQTKNEAVPLFYDELINRLGNKNEDLDLLIEKYSEPFEIYENKTTYDKIKHYIKMLIYK